MARISSKLKILKIMKISQYNWNWWFVLTMLVISFGIVLCLCDDPIGDILSVIGIISLLPCLYIGLKERDE